MHQEERLSGVVHRGVLQRMKQVVMSTSVHGSGMAVIASRHPGVRAPGEAHEGILFCTVNTCREGCVVV